MSRTQIKKLIQQDTAVMATGCAGAGDYADYAQSQGYDYCEVVDWTSSAGDWTFIVSKDGNEWYLMYQENNYPGYGFTRTIDTSMAFYGNHEDAIQQIVDFYY
jgi:hypothetical protein